MSGLGKGQQMLINTLDVFFFQFLAKTGEKTLWGWVSIIRAYSLSICSFFCPFHSPDIHFWGVGL